MSRKLGSKNLSITKSGSAIRKDNGEIVFISLEDFKGRILSGSRCFMCCEYKDFLPKKEHLYSDWVLRRYDLYSRSGNLESPHGNGGYYDVLKVRCCSKCNSYLGVNLEEKISALTRNGYEDLIGNMTEETYTLIYVWMASLFFKNYYRLQAYRTSKDSRESHVKIREVWPPSVVHQIYNVYRSIKTGLKIDRSALGSVFVFKMKDESKEDNFDLVESFWSRSLYIKLGDIGIMTNFGDRKYNLKNLGFLSDLDPLEKIEGREIFSYLCSSARTTPLETLHEVVDHEDDGIVCLIGRTLGVKYRYSELETLDIYKEMLHSICWPIAKNMGYPPAVEELLLRGEFSFLSKTNAKALNLSDLLDPDRSIFL